MYVPPCINTLKLGTFSVPLTMKETIIIDVDLRLHSFIITCVPQQLLITQIELVNIVAWNNDCTMCALKQYKMPREEQSGYREYL